MADEKRNLVSSSMIDLKAELFRKQEEFKRQKAAGSGFVKGKTASEKKNVKGNLWTRQNAGVLARAQKDLEAKSDTEEGEDLLAKSRKALEEKSKLYDKITNSSGIPEEDGSDYYLVDFQKKAIDSIVEEREAARKKQEEEKEEEAERLALAAEIAQPSCPDEEWVDFTDSLGRERRCLRKDLDRLMKQDKELALAQSSKMSVEEKSKFSGENDVKRDEPHLMSSDMHREMMRQKWENEAKELLEKGQEEIHYSNVRFDEIRSHGVGFYQFSKDHEKREEQMEDLKKMHSETLEECSRKDRIKDKRKAMMEARLAKVRERRKIKGDVVVEAKPENKDDEEMIGPKLSKAATTEFSEDRVKKEEQEREAEEKRKHHVREWDKDKKPSGWVGKNYVEIRRDEREEEFAPPSVYFDEPKSTPKRTSDEHRMKRLQTTVKTAKSEFAPPPTYNSEKPGQGTKNSDSSDNSRPAQANLQQELQSSQTSNCPPQTISQEMFWEGGSVNYASEWDKLDFHLNNQSQFANGNQQNYTATAQYSQYDTSNQYGYNPHFYQQNPSGNPQYTYQNYNESMQQYNQQYQYMSNPQYGETYSANPQQQLGFNTFTAPSPTVNYNSQPSSNESGASIAKGTKREAYHTGVEASKKPKIPKMAIVDTRFVNNDVVPQLSETVVPSSQVTAVPYTPGSFTAAKQSVASKYEELVSETKHKEQISVSPLIYTSDQQKRQEEILKQGGDEKDQDADADKKLQDFLTSIRTGQS